MDVSIRYALPHPLDDLGTVMTRKGKALREPTTDENQIVFVSDEDPAIVVTFNKSTVGGEIVLKH